MSSHARRGHTAPRRAPRNRRQSPLLIAGIGLLAAAGVFAAMALRAGQDRAAAPATQAAGGPAALAVSPPAYDLGQVSQAKGVITVELAVTNTGGAELEIREMETTCGCTSASLVTNGTAGPWFGMRGHGDWPEGWSARLRPGQQATLRVRYDPDAHGIYRGPIDRTVFIYSNDPRQPRAAVRLTGTQVP
ncbi:MAG: DUF1573 domain-containing protein [Armatimonadota bacterium]|nr:DUF1573 domain-containing protein [Armatimonadota bacterium]